MSFWLRLNAPEAESGLSGVARSDREREGVPNGWTESAIPISCGSSSGFFFFFIRSRRPVSATLAIENTEAAARQRSSRRIGDSEFVALKVISPGLWLTVTRWSSPDRLRVALASSAIIVGKKIITLFIYFFLILFFSINVDSPQRLRFPDRRSNSAMLGAHAAGFLAGKASDFI